MPALDLVVLADLHYIGPDRPERPLPERRAHLALELAVRAVRDSLRSGRPDALVLLGDLVEDGSAPHAREDMESLREALAGFNLPMLVVPGNHDRSPELVAEVFGPGSRPGLHELRDFSLVIFADRYDEHERCTRDDGAMKLLRSAAASGRPTIVLQHPPLLPRIRAEYPYTIEKAEELAAAYAAAGVTLSLSGHYHAGQEFHESGGVGHLTCPALCQAPFAYCRVRLEGRRIAQVRTVPLAPAQFAHLFDAHVHTEFAYCAEDISVEGAIARMRALGLPHPAFVEHADQLYFPRPGFWKRTDCDELTAMRRAAAEGHARHRAFRERMRPVREAGVLLGLECEPEASGHGLAAEEEDLAGYDYLIGSVHYLEKGSDAAVPQAEIVRRFMARTEQLARAGIDILGHPFRYFPRHDRPVPRELFRPVAEMLAAEGVATEINFHTDQPPPEFFAECMERGARLSIGSDAHALAEVGDLKPHLGILESIGALARLDEVLWRPRAAATSAGQPPPASAS